MSTIPGRFRLFLHDEHVGHGIQIVDPFAVIDINILHVEKSYYYAVLKKRENTNCDNTLRNIIPMDKKTYHQRK